MKGWEAESSREMTERQEVMMEGMDRGNIGTDRAAPTFSLNDIKEKRRHKRPEMQAFLSSFLVALDSNISWGGLLGRQISTHIKVRHSLTCACTLVLGIQRKNNLESALAS